MPPRVLTKLKADNAHEICIYNKFHLFTFQGIADVRTTRLILVREEANLRHHVRPSPIPNTVEGIELSWNCPMSRSVSKLHSTFTQNIGHYVFNFITAVDPWDKMTWPRAVRLRKILHRRNDIRGMAGTDSSRPFGHFLCGCCYQYSAKQKL